MSRPLPPSRRFGGGHCRLIEQTDRPELELLELESGDAIGLGSAFARARALLSLDDVDRTLAGPGAETGIATAALTPAECRVLAARLLDRAAYLERLDQESARSGSSR